MTTPRYDAVIAGGGLSGLSLAARLATNAWRDRRVLLVDDGGATSPARCWAYWSREPATAQAARAGGTARNRAGGARGTPRAAVPAGPLEADVPVRPLDAAVPAGPLDAAVPVEPLEADVPVEPLEADVPVEPLDAAVPVRPLDAAVSACYDRVRMHAGGESLTLPLGRYRYRLVFRADLRHSVLALLAERSGFEVRTGKAEAVRNGPGHAEVVVDGQVVRADWVFDSVSHRWEDHERPADARLAFTGWEVRCPSPVFDPLTPTLFDFRVPQRGGSRFVYVLPVDRHRALVEVTSFVARDAVPPGPEERDAVLRAYLPEVAGCRDYEIVRTESAVLPLHAFPAPRRHGRILAIGAAGGLIKASTGYAYQRIQRDCAAVAASLIRHGHPFALPRPHLRHRLLDAVLLEVLHSDPARLEEAFARLFAANPVERVLAFLDEDSTAFGDLRLIASLPPAPYLAGAAHWAARASRTGHFGGQGHARRGVGPRSG